MKIQRTKNAARNIVFDGLSRLVSVLIPFLMRSVMLRCLGVEYLGLNGLFRSLLAFLNLAELGVGSAMVFSMYKPIAEDDADTICALMRLYRRFYRAIGLFIAAVGLALTPFLRVLVKGEVPAGVDLCVLYFLNLGSTVLTYWLFAYKNSLLKAHQRGDVGSRIALAVRSAEFVLKLAALTRLHSYYLYLIIQLLAQIATNIITARRVDRLYPAYAPRGELPKEQVRDITRRVRDFFTAKFSHTISESADTLVISAFLGLTALAVYQNYFYILVSLRGFLEVIIGACIAGVGNSLVTESREKNYRDLRRFSLLFGWLTGVSTAMLLCLYQPFMRLWMGEEHMLTANYVICFAVYYYTVGMNKIINMFKDAAGIWHRDRFRPLTAALVNLTLNLATVRALGLYGVLLSTVVSIVLVQIPWLLHNLFSEIFPREHLWGYTRDFCMLALVALAACAASWLICARLEAGPWGMLLLCGVVSFGVSNLFFFLCYGRSTLLRDTAAQLKRALLSRADTPR